LGPHHKISKVERESMAVAEPLPPAVMAPVTVLAVMAAVAEPTRCPTTTRRGWSRRTCSAPSALSSWRAAFQAGLRTAAVAVEV